MPAVTFVDLFSGVGGFSLGCIQAGMRQLAAFDKVPEMVAAYGLNLAHEQASAAARVLDLSTASVADVLTATGNVRPEVVVGGPPCQGFSIIGLRNPLDPRSELSLKFAEIVVALRPTAFAMENVPGLFHAGTTKEDLRRRLVDAGYANATWLRVNAADFGVPQRRHRVLLVGSLVGEAPTAAGLVLAGTAAVTVNDALDGLPQPLARGKLPPGGRIAYDTRSGSWSAYATALRNTEGDVSGCQLTNHVLEMRKRLARLKQGERDPKNYYRRLQGGGVAMALRAGTRDRTACRPMHPRRDRVITVREAARLHGFPDWYEFSDVVSLGHVQIGNSVPPPLGRAVGLKLVEYALAARAQGALATSAA